MLMQVVISKLANTKLKSHVTVTIRSKTNDTYS